MRNSGQKPFPVNAKNEARLNHLRSISSFLRQEMYTLLCTCVDYQMQSCFCIITIENICWRFNLNGTVNLGASCQVHVQGSRVKSTLLLSSQVELMKALESRQRYVDCLARVQSKLGSASAELQLLEADSSPEHARDLLEQHQVRVCARNSKLCLVS